MATANPFAQPPTPDVIVQQLTRQLTSDYPQAGAVTNPSLEALVDETVRDLWRSRVKTFVPVFALREMRLVLEARGLVKQPTPTSHGATRPRTAHRPETALARSGGDRLPVGSDVTPLDADDVLALNDRDALPR